MQKVDQERITLLSLMGESAGESLEEKYEEAKAMFNTLVEEGWFGGSGNSPGRRPTSEKQDSNTKSSKKDRDNEPATKVQVQRVIDLDDSYEVEELEAMTQGEIKALYRSLRS